MPMSAFEMPKEGPQTDAERQKQRINYTEADRVITNEAYPEEMDEAEVQNFTIGENCPSLSYGLMNQLFKKNSWRQLSKPQQRFINQIVLMVDKSFDGRRDVDTANQGDDWTFVFPKDGSPAKFTFVPRGGKGLRINGAELEYFEQPSEEQRFLKAQRDIIQIGLGNNMSLTDLLKQLRQKVSFEDRVRLLRDEDKTWTEEDVERTGGYVELIKDINQEMRNFLDIPGLSENHKTELFDAYRAQQIDQGASSKKNLNYTGAGLQNLAWVISIRRQFGNPPTVQDVTASLKGIGFLGGYKTVDPVENSQFGTAEAKAYDDDSVEWGKYEDKEEKDDTGRAWKPLNERDDSAWEVVTD